MSEKEVIDTVKKSEDGSLPVAEEVTKKDNKKPSKKWKRKFSKRESSSTESKEAKTGGQETECQNLQDEASGVKENKHDNEERGEFSKGRKSIKGRITGKLRKLSRADKKVYSDLKVDEENTVETGSEEQNGGSNEGQGESSLPATAAESLENGNKEEQVLLPVNEVEECGEGEEKEEMSTIVQSSTIGEDEVGENGEEDEEVKDQIVEGKAEGSNDDGFIHDDGEASRFETSEEQRQIEEDERRKSKELFDAVVCELDVNNKVCSGDAEERVEEKACDSDAEEFQANTPVKMSELLKDEEGNDEDQQQQQVNNVDTNDVSEKNTDENEAVEHEKEATKLLSPTKEDNNELSQRIARKAVGKLSNKYRQVQITRTYCTQCCTVM
eukprot:gene14123-15600_t